MKLSFLHVTVHFFTPESNKRHSFCIALRWFPSPHTGLRIAEFLHRIVAEWEIPRNKLFKSFYRQWKRHGFSIENKQKQWRWLLNLMVMNLIQIVTLEEIFRDQYVHHEMENMGGSSSEVDNFDIMWERSPKGIFRLEVFRLLCTYVAIGCEGLWNCTNI